jgi:hypothetical protein
MTSEGMGVLWLRDQGFYGSPDGIYHFGVERAHDIRGPPFGRWVVGKHPDCLGATPTTGGWSPSSHYAFVLVTRAFTYPRGL